jgi:steroid 5-alpha reductase family enzyme
MNTYVILISAVMSVAMMYALLYVDARFGLKKLVAVAWEYLTVALAFAVCFGLAYGIVAKAFLQ